MTNLKIIQNKDNDSFHLGSLPKGCQHCVKGEKLVLFITGLCSQKCYFCPVSEQKFGHDKIFADEWEMAEDDTGKLIKEAELIDAKGAGITGGDPLCVLDRTCKYIKLLKEKFGKQFHIHLYTPLKLVTKENLAKLYEAGLDEIRFHPDLENDKDWHKLELAQKFGWDIGIEIPCVPDKGTEIKKLIDYSKDLVKFINLNELELSDTKVEHYDLSNFEAKDKLSYGVKGSSELGRELIDYVKDKNYGLNIYFCTARLKDKTQLGNRMKRRAKNAAKKTDIITDEGTLIRGVIYLPDYKPGFGYHDKLKAMGDEEKNKVVAELEKVKQSLEEKFRVTNKIIVDPAKLRLLISKKLVQIHKKRIVKEGLVPAIVEEYPTEDALELEVEFL
jgi:uncharacterized protein